MTERTLSYNESNMVDTAKIVANALGISWQRVVDTFSSSDESLYLREFRAADHSFTAFDWLRITDWAPPVVKKGDFLWSTGLGVVEVTSCGAKKSSFRWSDSPTGNRIPVSTEEFTGGIVIPKDKVSAVEAFLIGFYMGIKASGKELFVLNTVSALQIRWGVQRILKA